MQARLRIFWALAISLVLHFWLISDTKFSIPDWEPISSPIHVTLSPKEVSTHSGISPKKTIPLATSKTKSPPSRHTQIPLIKGTPTTISSTPTENPNTTPLAETPHVSVTPEPGVAETIPASEEALLSPVTETEEETPTALPPPKRVEIEFRGANGSKGEGTQHFELVENGRYSLRSEMSMPVFLFVSGKIEQTSEGLITEHGLQPLTFHQKTTGSKALTATFNWIDNKVTLDGKRQETIDLPSGTQDLVSFMYQFMFVPPLNEMRLSVITGKKLKTYLYAFEGEDTLATPAGTFKAIHIAKSNQDGDEKTELWLAVDYRHLPIRIKKTEKDGTAYDLVVNRITLTE